MAEEIKIEATLVDPVSVIVETKEKDKVKNQEILGLNKSQLDFWKWVVGTFILGLAGVISTIIFKSYELKIASRTSENTYLNSYLNQYINIGKGDSSHKLENTKKCLTSYI